MVEKVRNCTNEAIMSLQMNGEHDAKGQKGKKGRDREWVIKLVKHTRENTLDTGRVCMFVCEEGKFPTDAFPRRATGMLSKNKRLLLTLRWRVNRCLVLGSGPVSEVSFATSSHTCSDKSQLIRLEMLKITLIAYIQAVLSLADPIDKLNKH